MTTNATTARPPAIFVPPLFVSQVCNPESFVVITITRNDADVKHIFDEIFVVDLRVREVDIIKRFDVF